MPKTEIENEKRIRIGNMQGALMFGVAVGFDALQGILTTAFIGVIFDTFIAIFAWLLFYFWFKLNSVGFLDGKVVLKLVAWFGSWLIEMIPIINNLPAIVLPVVILFLIVRAEDMLYNKTGKDIRIAKELKKFRRRIV